MTTVISKDSIPNHLFSIPELDFSADLLAECPGTPWFRLGAWTVASRRNERGIENVVDRQSFLFASGRFTEIFDELESIGNVTRQDGKARRLNLLWG